ncbi:hypothetical protein [Ferrimonas pelagia]|uniref:Uncharacterized protein n=1 Tax=Ferrimonas pelagia TaxID=1177826 RepID=A0ABP9EYK6_9GAMM
MLRAKWLILAVAMALPAAANHYGGTQYYQLVKQSEQAPARVVVAQATSREALKAELAMDTERDINQLLQESPTAAGGEAGEIEAIQVVERCYHSVQAVACKTKTVYQLVK